MTSLNRNSKADTVLLCDRTDGLSALATDQSQYRTDLTNNTTYLSEAASARTAITYPREISGYFEADSNDVGIIVNHGNAAGTSYTYRVRVNSGVLEVAENGILRASVALPNVAPVDRAYCFQWSTRAEGTSVRTELTVCDITGGGVFAHAYGLHAAGTTNAAWDLTISGYGAGVSGHDITKIWAVRIGQRFHSQAELKEDWFSESTPPTLEATLRDAPLPFNRDTALGDESAFAGPVYLWGGATVRQCDRRLISPLANMRIADRGVALLDNTFTPAQRYLRAWGDNRLRFCGQTIAYRPVSPKTNRIRARLQCVVWSAGGTPCDLQFSLYSVAGFDWEGEAKQKRVYYYTPMVTATLDHGGIGAVGEWVDLGDTRIAVDDWGCSLFMLAVAFDLDSGSVAADDTRLMLQALTIEPYYQVPTNGYAAGDDLALP